jgi:hypothetical protein
MDASPELFPVEEQLLLLFCLSERGQQTVAPHLLIVDLFVLHDREQHLVKRATMLRVTGTHERLHPIHWRWSIAFFKKYLYI